MALVLDHCLYKLTIDETRQDIASSNITCKNVRSATSSVVKRGLWDISSAVYANCSLDISGATGAPHDLCVVDNNSKVFVISDSKIQRWSLGSAGYIDSASEDPDQELDISEWEGQAKGIWVHPDGDVLLLCGNTSRAVIALSLPTPFSLVGATLISSFPLSDWDTQPVSIAGRPDGLGFFVNGQVTDKVYSFICSAAKDYSATSVSYTGQSFDLRGFDTSPTGLTLTDNGYGFYCIGAVTDKVYQINMSTAYDLDTAVDSGKSFSVAARESIPTGIFARPEGALFWTCGLANKKIDQYHMSH